MMSGSLSPPLRSALKQSSRPSSPVSPGTISPQITRVPLPSSSPTSMSSSPLAMSPAGISTPTPTQTHFPFSQSTVDSLSSTQSSSPVSASGSQSQSLSQCQSQTLPLPSSMSHGHHHHPHNPLASPSYTPKVSFDTFENPVASMFSFTLQVKSAGYRRTRNTRVFLCASSPDESGREALDWCLEALVQDGDELIVFRGLDEDVLDKPHDALRAEARALMLSIQAKSVEYDADRKLSLILEFIPGKITDTIDRLIALYRPDSLVVGTRGRRFGVGLVQGIGAGLVQGLGVGSGVSIGSVSKYCLSHSPVPVIVVRPGRKLRKAVEKRRADPKRGKHFE
ncbi:hypothetical protein GALMADRAFT_95530 [Galerina marginata CBS 339.88]|uniref:UspA domain-containing protein n=1 Tax=Galerina marginata (strain CBS 339.88) TaxID=685588 RepID=A0A067T151_GALM3|nr:hypothetical protein GALMADRAFT_95530 [Galerina marginata CBS 339.88]